MPVRSDFRDGCKWGVLTHSQGKPPQAMEQEAPGFWGTMPWLIGHHKYCSIQNLVAYLEVAYLEVKLPSYLVLNSEIKYILYLSSH